MAPPNTDQEPTHCAWPLQLTSLLVGGAVFVGLVVGISDRHPRAPQRPVTGGAEMRTGPARGGVPTTGVAMPQEAPAQGGPPSPTVRTPAPTSVRTWFVTLADAEQALGLHLLAPTALPFGVYLLGVAWEQQPDPARPGAPAAERLIAWYGDEDRATVFYLEQAASHPHPPCDPSVALPRLALVSGEAVCGGTVAGAPGGWQERWLGPVGSATPWRLVSTVLSFDELLLIADGLR